MSLYTVSSRLELADRCSHLLHWLSSASAFARELDRYNEKTPNKLSKMAAYSRSDYTRAETSDATTNVPLLSEDSLDDETLNGRQKDPVLIVTDNVDDNHQVRFSVSSAKASSIHLPCKLTKTSVFIAIIAILIIICVVLSALLARQSPEQGTNVSVKGTNVCVSEGCIDAAYHIFHSMDRSVKPCDNFYEFACGGWAQNNPIPESKSFWGVYSVLQEENERIVKQLLTGASGESVTTKKAKTFYDACMDDTTIDKIGAKPLLDIINDLGGWNIAPPWEKSKFNFERTLKTVHKNYSVTAFFSVDVDTDDKNSSKNIIKVR